MRTPINIPSRSAQNGDFNFIQETKGDFIISSIVSYVKNIYIIKNKLPLMGLETTMAF